MFQDSVSRGCIIPHPEIHLTSLIQSENLPFPDRTRTLPEAKVDFFSPTGRGQQELLLLVPNGELSRWVSRLMGLPKAKRRECSTFDYIVNQGGKDPGLGRSGCDHCFQTFCFFLPFLGEGEREIRG